MGVHGTEAERAATEDYTLLGKWTFRSRPDLSIPYPSMHAHFQFAEVIRNTLLRNLVTFAPPRPLSCSKAAAR